MIRRLFLLFKELEDGPVRENFRRIADFLREDPFAKGVFQFFEIDFAAPAYPAQVTFRHGLDFVPKDIIQTSVKGGVINWEYDQFTNVFLVAGISAPLTVRAYVGSYAEGRVV